LHSHKAKLEETLNQKKNQNEEHLKSMSAWSVDKNDKSSKILEKNKLNRFNAIFALLDSDQDQVISHQKIDIFCMLLCFIFC
jgi:hypothetical protein